jgi:hypothetical protein
MFALQTHAIACVPTGDPENPEVMFCPVFIPPVIPPPPVPIVDTTSPTVVSITATELPTNTPYTVTITFSESVLGSFSLDDIYNRNLPTESLALSNLQTSDGGVTYTFTVSGPDGNHQVTLRDGSVSDAAGNVFTTTDKAAYVTLDTTAPSVTIQDGPQEGSTHTSYTHTFLFNGSDVSDSQIDFECAFVSGNAAALASAVYVPCSPLEPVEGVNDSSYSPTISTDGMYTFAVRARDNLGNTSIPSVESGSVRTFSVDTTVPIVTITRPVPSGGTLTVPQFTVVTSESVALEFFGPCGSATPLTLSSGEHTLSFNLLPPGTYGMNREEEGDGFKKGDVCFFRASDGANNATFVFMPMFVVIESPVQVGGGGGNGPITVVTGTLTFTGESPVVIASSTVQPGDGGRVIIGQNSIVPTTSALEITTPVIVVNDPAAPITPTTTPTFTVTTSQPVITTQPAPRRVAVRPTQPRTPRIVRPATPPQTGSSTQTNTSSDTAPGNQTASAADASGSLWRYIFSFFGY